MRLDWTGLACPGESALSRGWVHSERQSRTSCKIYCMGGMAPETGVGQAGRSAMVPQDRPQSRSLSPEASVSGPGPGPSGFLSPDLKLRGVSTEQTMVR